MSPRYGAGSRMLLRAAPNVRYARSADGARIAYAVVGDAPTTAVFVPGVISQLEVAWDEPMYRRFMGELAGRYRVVVFDRRGTGLSDRVGAAVAHGDLTADLRAVLDASDAERAVLIGFSMGSLAAIQFAVEHPDRISALVVIAGMARWLRARDQSFGLTRAEFELMVGALEEGWGTGVSLPGSCPSMMADRRFREWGARLERHSCPPGSVRSVFALAAACDVRSVLGDVQAPTLVLHRAGDQVIDVAHGRHLAASIPGALYRELKGDDHTYFVGDQRAMSNEIVGFLADVFGVDGPPRGLRSVVERVLAVGELDVAELVAAGLTNIEIARRLYVSPHTVDSRLRRAFSKLGVRRRSELAAHIGSLT
jgi:pimeloyl-ACP methyl ester carboxylesterase/DNA-binding CsgD family transcriptional regulator